MQNGQEVTEMHLFMYFQDDSLCHRGFVFLYFWTTREVTFNTLAGCILLPMSSWSGLM